MREVKRAVDRIVGEGEERFLKKFLGYDEFIPDEEVKEGLYRQRKRAEKKRAEAEEQLLNDLWDDEEAKRRAFENLMMDGFADEGDVYETAGFEEGFFDIR